MTAFGTVGSALAAVGAAAVSLKIAAKDRKAADRALKKQLDAADNSLAKQLDAGDRTLRTQIDAAIDEQREQVRADREQGRIERESDLLTALLEQLGEMQGYLRMPQFHPARAKAIGLFAALGGAERMPTVSSSFYGVGATDNLEAAINEVAQMIASLPF